METEPVVTPFQKRVYAAICRIPRGSVATYAAVARAIGCGSARAVGQALRRNPFSPEVPCHRVVRSDLAIGGFSGERSGAAVRRKARLLKEEGVLFGGEGKLADTARVFRFPADGNH